MPKKRQILAEDSDQEKEDVQPKKRSRKETKEVINIDSDEDNEVPKTPKTTPKSKSKKKEKETQKNTLHNYFFIGNKTTPTSSKPKENESSTTPKAVTPKATTPKSPSDKAPKTKLQLDESPKSKSSPKKLDAKPSVLRNSPTKLVLDDEDIKEKALAKTPQPKSEKEKKRETHKSEHHKKNGKSEVKEGSEAAEAKPKREDEGESAKPAKLNESHEDRKRKLKVSVERNNAKEMKTEKPAVGIASKMGEKRRSGGGGNYAAYMNREGPREIGLKELPEGDRDCLSGMNFVITGVLESMERDDAKDYVEKHGGKVTTGVSKKTTYLVAGREPGLSKINKAEQLKVKQINEDELFDMIRSKSIQKPAVKESTKSTDETESSYFSSESPKKLSTDVKTKEPPKSPTKTESIKKFPSPEKLKQQASRMNGNGDTKPSASHALLWVDKYKPKSLKQVIGQQTPGSVAQKLLVWLRNWHKHLEEGTKKNGSVGFTRGARDDGCLFKAALLSGPPGIGKTTAATLVCEELGFSFVELNASDTRSKRSLKEHVSETVGSHSVVDFLQSSNKGGKKHCLLMDEVDGMAGNEDRGGIGELIQVIKQSKIPIICMCNDRSHQKMRSLVNYCFDLRFQRPRVDQIKAAMMSIVFKEGLSIPQASVAEMITASNNDIRQTINNLAMWTASEKKLTDEQMKKDATKAKKDLRYNVFDVIKKILAPEVNDDTSIRGVTDLFFQDYQMGPLFVQENYLNVKPAAGGNDPDAALALISKASDAIAMGDIVNRRIRSGNNWSLLTTQALFSAVLPGHHMRGNFVAGVGFPSWLGKFSSQKRSARLLQQLSSHIRLPTGGVVPSELAMGSAKALLNHVTSPLIRRGTEGVEETISNLRSYDLLREDLDILSECSLWSNQRDPMSQVDSKTKAALTRTYNKAGILTPYALTTGGTKKGRGRGGGGDEVEGEFDDGEGVEEEEDDDDITKDAMVKVSKAKAKAAPAKKTKAKAKETAGPSKKKKAK